MSDSTEKSRKVDPKIIACIAGGAVIGGIAGYIINKVGFKNVTKMLKDRNIITNEVGSILENFDLKAFTSKARKDLEDLSED